MVPSDDDNARFESLPVLLALWEPFQQRLSKHLSELTEGQIDREEMFWFDAAHVTAMIAVVEAEAVTAPPDSVVMTANVLIHSPDAGSFQFSHRPAIPNGKPSSSSSPPRQS
jgi:hypothetical protein